MSAEPIRPLSLTADEIPAAVDAVRVRGGEVFTNWFLSPLKQREPITAWASDASIAFSDHENGVDRLYYVTVDLADLARLLPVARRSSNVCDHFGRKEIDPALAAAFEAAGLRRAARYLRIRRTRRPRTAEGVRRDVALASVDEVDLIHARLQRDFDSHLDYVPDRDEIAGLIRDRRILVRRSAEIDGYLVYRIDGRSARWDFIATRPGAPPVVASALLADFESELAALGVDRVTGWCDERRRAHLAAYSGCGYRSDGLVRTTFIGDESWRPRERASAAYDVAPRSANADGGARAAVVVALDAVNAAIAPAMRVDLDDDASLDALDSLALMNLLVGIEQAILDAFDLEVSMTGAAQAALDGPPEHSPIATVGRLVAFADARVAEARR